MKSMEIIKYEHLERQPIATHKDSIHVVDLRVLAKECIQNLKSYSETAALSKLKALLFRVHRLLDQGLFAEEVMAFRGMEVWVKTINFSVKPRCSSTDWSGSIRMRPLSECSSTLYEMTRHQISWLSAALCGCSRSSGNI